METFLAILFVITCGLLLASNEVDKWVTKLINKELG